MASPWLRAGGALLAGLLLVMASSQLAFGTSLPASDQEMYVRALREDLVQSHGGAASSREPKVYWRRDGRAAGVRAPRGFAFAATGSHAATPEDAGAAFLQNHTTLFGLNPQDALIPKPVRAGQRNGNVRFSQRFRGVPVFAAEAVLQLDEGLHVQSAMASLANVPLQTAVAPSFDETAVRKVAQDWAASREPSLVPGAVELCIFDPALLELPGSPRLAYTVALQRPGASGTDLDLVVDAVNGEILYRDSHRYELLNRTVSDGRNDWGNIPGVPVRREGSLPSGIADVDAAYDLMGQLYNFYQSRFNRVGVNRSGLTPYMTVRACPSDGKFCPWPNAQWTGYNSIWMGDTWATDDIVGHEWGHGVTESESGLKYSNASGAINESLSDIAGEFFDVSTNTAGDAPGDRWLIAEDVNGGAIRSMSNPPSYSQPDRLYGPFYQCPVTVPDDDTNDNGYVHTNSGICNKLASLLVDGGSHNGYTITPLGWPGVAALFYEANANTLTSTAGWADLSNGLQQAAVNLGWSAVQCDNLLQACLSVGIEPIDTGADPVLIAPSAGKQCIDPSSGVTFEWTNVYDAVRYDFALGVVGGAILVESSVQSDQLSSGNRVTYSPGVPYQHDVTYFWKVRAYPACGGTASTWVRREFTTKPAVPPTPLLLAPAANATGVQTQGTLNWADIPNIIYYGVHVRCVASGEQVLYRTVTASECPFNLPDATYEWNVQANRSCGVASSPSPWIRFTVGVGSSCPIPVLSSPATGSTCLPDSGVLRWEPVPGAAGYIVSLGRHRCGDEEFSFHVTAPEVAFSGLRHGETYYWRVKVDCNCAPSSDCYSFQVGDDWNKIVDLNSPADGTSDQYTMGTLSWSPIAEADSFQVQLGTSCASGPEVVVSTASLAYSNLLANTTYYWRVRAHGARGTSGCPHWGDYQDCFNFRTGNGTNRVYLPEGLSFERGTAVMVPIRGENTTALKRFDVEVNWDRNVFDYVGWAIAGTKAEGAARIDSSGDPNTLRLNVRYAMDHCPPSIAVGDGVLFYLMLNVKGNAPLGATPISFSVSSFEGCTGGVSPLVFDDTATITGSGMDQFYFPSGLTVATGQPVVIPVRAENLAAMKEYGFRVQWDRLVFDYLGTILAGTKGENPSHVDSTHNVDFVNFRIQQQPCPPGIPAGDGELARVVLRAKSSAPAGPTTLTFDQRNSENYYHDCNGQNVTPAKLSGQVVVTTIVGVAEDPALVVPEGLALRAAPNPLSESTGIRFYLPAGGLVDLAVFDVAGRLVATLAKGDWSPGWHEQRWNGRTGYGSKAPSGIYFLRLKANGDTRTTRVVLSK